MSFGRRFPEIRLHRRGAHIKTVEWVDRPDIEVTSLDSPYREYVPGADEVIDMTGMRILSVEKKVEPGELPKVTLTLIARLVELDAETS